MTYLGAGKAKNGSKERWEAYRDFASGDAGLWATFAAAVVPWQVDLHLKHTRTSLGMRTTSAHFNVPGVEACGGLPMGLWQLAAENR